MIVVAYIESVSNKYNFSLNMLLLGQNNVFQLHTTFITNIYTTDFIEISAIQKE